MKIQKEKDNIINIKLININNFYKVAEKLSGTHQGIVGKNLLTFNINHYLSAELNSY